MESVKTLLSKLGLANSEVRIYLTGLEKGSMTVEDVARHTKLKLPTIYHALSQLTEKELAHKQRSEGRLMYLFEPAEGLESLIQQQHADLRQYADELKGLLPLFPRLDQPTQQYRTEAFIGHDQVRRAIDAALFCSSKHWDILAPVKNYLAESDETYTNYFKDMRVRNGIQSRSLWEDRVGKEPLRLADLVTRKPRYLPERYRGQFKSMMILFEDKTLLIGTYSTPVAQLIYSKDFTEMMGMMFDTLWRSGAKER